MTDFTPVDCGDMNDIPPDLPAGEWEALCAVKKSKTAKDGFPMLVLEWRTTAVADGNEDNENYVGARATDFVTFFPASHKATRMARVRLQQMCKALNVEMPKAQKLSSWDDVADFIASLEGLKANIWTSVETRKDTGAQVTKVHYAPPGRKVGPLPAPEEDDEEEAPKPKKGKK